MKPLLRLLLNPDHFDRNGTQQAFQLQGEIPFDVRKF